MKYSIGFRNSILLLLVLAMGACCLFMPAQAVSVSDFEDVSSAHWYYDAVSYCVSEGLFNGVTSTEFAPNDYMTRGMFITVLGRFAGVDPELWLGGTVTGSYVRVRSGPGTSYEELTQLAYGTGVTILGVSGDWYKIRSGSYTGYMSADYISPDYHAFEDVSYGNYFAGYAVWGYENGIVKGAGSSAYYAPWDCITREEICCLLNRYVCFADITLATGDTVDFTDEASISSWAAADVAAMQSGGIVQGEKEGDGYCFRPQSYATRAEVATMFMRLGEKAAQGDDNEDSASTPTPTPVPEDRALFLGSKVAVSSDIIRVGLYSSTSSVTLANLSGDSFEYGYFNSSRVFVSSGTIEASSVTVTSTGTSFSVKNSAGTTVHTSTSNFALRPVSDGKALTRVNGENRYYGGFEFRQSSTSGKIILINVLDIEDYVKGVLPYEFGTGWPAETLKAGAIAVRSFAMSYDRSIYSSRGYDISASVQVYRGRGSSYGSSYFSATDAAVAATENVYLTYSSSGTRKICETYYFSSDGGATEDSAHIWGGSYSYLVGKVDPYEQAASSLASNYTYSITNSRTGSRLTSLASSLGLGTIAADGIRVEKYSDTGNVYRVVITDTSGKTAYITRTSSVDRWDFLSEFGFTAYSYRYDVTYNAAADTFTCTRWGWGHNVGMSQWGAYAMAKYYGKDYQDILGFYYDGTSLQYGA